MQKSKKFIIEDKQGNNMYPATFADVVFTEDGGNVAEKLKQIEGATPNAHTHTKSQITDFAHTHSVDDVINGISIWESSDINNYKKNGIWYFSNANGHTNAPPNLSYFSLRVEKYGQQDESYIRQTAQEILNHTAYTRTWRGSTNGWTEWKAVDAKTLSGKDLDYFAPKHHTTLTGTTKINQLMVQEKVEVRYAPFSNHVFNSTFKYGLKGWDYKQGNGVWGTNNYPLVGSSVYCNGGATGLTYIDARNYSYYIGGEGKLFLSFCANTATSKTGRVLVEVIDKSTHNKIADVAVPNSTGWTTYFKEIPITKAGDYYVRLVVNDNADRVHFSKIKLSHYGFSQWCENELDAITFGGGDGVIKSIQRGIIQVNSGEDEKTVTLSQINASKSFVILNGDYSPSSDITAPYVKTLNNGNLVIANSYGTVNRTTVYISWQVIEFK